MIITVLLAALFVTLGFAFPEKALAWGPVTHLQLGIDTLRQMNIFDQGLRMLLQSFPYHFLYGCIGADIIFAKGLAKLHEHSHSWNTGFSVLAESRTPSQEAFAYGYLCHLAADAIAHNLFIPECVVKTYTAKTFRHVYWEVRFDHWAESQFWDLAQEIARLPQHEEADELLEKVVKRTLFSFKTDKRIFHSIITLNRLNQWKKMLNSLSEKSPWKLKRNQVRTYRELSMRNTLDFLVHQGDAACIQMDPIGKRALLSAKWMRRNLRMLNKRGRLEPSLYSQVLDTLRPDNWGKQVPHPF